MTEPAPAPSRSAARRGALALLAVATLVGGCALLAPRLEKPRLTVVGIEVVDAQLMEQRFNVRMRVQNPNDRALPVRGLTYTMQLAGEEFGHGMSAKAFTVPPLGEAEFDMIVTTNLATSLLKILPKLQNGGPGVDYRLDGKVTTDWTFLRTIPFSEQGRLATH
jgi:LEA14-like dessication related protein